MSDKLSELEPCRWCKGTKAKVLDFAESAIHVACPCGVQMFGGRAHFGSREEAIAAWNSRASPAPAITMPPLNDAMRAVLTNENCIYGTPDELYAALVKAAPAISESEDARDAARYRWLRSEHFPTAANPPLAQVVWKASDNRHTSIWANIIDGDDLDRSIDAARKGEKS